MIKSTRVAAVAVLSAILLASLSVQAGEQGVENAIRQLGRGLNNVLTGVLEIPAGILEVKEEHGDLPALTYGTLRGTYRCVVREGVGLFEVATFPAGFRPIVEPEFGGAPRVISESYEPDMRNSVGASGEWKIREVQKMPK